MRRTDLIEALQAGPFRPFRIYLSDGGTFDVRHPEMLMVGNHSAVIGIAPSRGNGDSAEVYPHIDRFTTIDLVHVTRIEQLPARTV
jgi:hypothetical protein